MAIEVEEKTIEIKKIVLKLGDTDIELTVGEAKQLKSALDNTLVTDYIPYYPPSVIQPSPWSGPHWTSEPSPFYVTSKTGVINNGG